MVKRRSFMKKIYIIYHLEKIQGSNINAIYKNYQYLIYTNNIKKLLNVTSENHQKI